MGANGGIEGCDFHRGGVMCRGEASMRVNKDDAGFAGGVTTHTCDDVGGDVGGGTSHESYDRFAAERGARNRFAGAGGGGCAMAIGVEACAENGRVADSPGSFPPTPPVEVAAARLPARSSATAPTVPWASTLSA